MDVACVIAEPTRHGVKAANQIAELLEFYQTPYVFVGNKVLNQEDQNFLYTHLKKHPIISFAHSADI
jgi:MinD superfamily P-loop ATPase containing an inserted ferredoxin domain